MRQFFKITCSLYICMHPIDSVLLKNPNRPGVLVWAAKTNYHRLGWLKQETFISHSSGGWKFEIWVPAWSSFWWVSYSWFTEGHLAVSSYVRKGRLPLWPLRSMLIPFMRLHPHDLITSPRPYLQVLLHWELDFNIKILRGHKHSVYDGRYSS